MNAPLNLNLTFKFLDELAKHNNKAWFEENRAAYESSRDTFYQLIDQLIDEIRVSDHLQSLSAKDCVMRINRDIRFSKDKSPYKTNFGATIAPGGKKSMQLGYHISLAPRGHSIVAGGLYMPTPQQLAGFRKAIDRSAAGFKKITAAASFVKYFAAVEGERLKTAPQGFDREHPELELLQLKQVTVIHKFSDQEVTRRDFPEQAITVFRAMKPFLNYLSDVSQ